MGMGGFVSEPFQKNIYLAHGGTGNGESAASPKALANGDLMAILPGMVIDKVDGVITTAIAGATACLVGDDDDADGYIADANMTEATPGAYVGNGAYLTGQLLAKYYSAAGKEVKWAQTGTSTAGAICVVVSGYKVA